MDLSSELGSFHGLDSISSDEEAQVVESDQPTAPTRRHVVYQALASFEDVETFREWWTNEGSTSMKKNYDSTNSSGEHVDYYG